LYQQNDVQGIVFSTAKKLSKTIKMSSLSHLQQNWKW